MFLWLNFLSMSNLASFFLQNSFAISVRLSSPNASLCMFNSIQWLSRLCVLVECHFNSYQGRAATFTNSILSLRKQKKFRSNKSEVFLGKSVLKICIKFTGEHPCRSAILEVWPKLWFLRTDFFAIYKILFSILAAGFPLGIMKPRFYKVTENLNVVIKKLCHKFVCTQHWHKQKLEVVF